MDQFQYSRSRACVSARGSGSATAWPTTKPSRTTPAKHLTTRIPLPALCQAQHPARRPHRPGVALSCEVRSPPLHRTPLPFRALPRRSNHSPGRTPAAQGRTTWAKTKKDRSVCHSEPPHVSWGSPNALCGDGPRTAASPRSRMPADRRGLTAPTPCSFAASVSPTRHLQHLRRTTAA